MGHILCAGQRKPRGCKGDGGHHLPVNQRLSQTQMRDTSLKWIVLGQTHHLDGELNRWRGSEDLEGVQDALLLQQAQRVCVGICVR